MLRCNDTRIGADMNVLFPLIGIVLGLVVAGWLLQVCLTMAGMW